MRVRNRRLCPARSPVASQWHPANWWAPQGLPAGCCCSLAACGVVGPLRGWRSQPAIQYRRRVRPGKRCKSQRLTRRCRPVDTCAASRCSATDSLLSASTRCAAPMQVECKGALCHMDARLRTAISCICVLSCRALEDCLRAACCPVALSTRATVALSERFTQEAVRAASAGPRRLTLPRSCPSLHTLSPLLTAAPSYSTTLLMLQQAMMLDVGSGADPAPLQ